MECRRVVLDHSESENDFYVLGESTNHPLPLDNRGIAIEVGGLACSEDEALAFLKHYAELIIDVRLRSNLFLLVAGILKTHSYHLLT